MDIFAKLKMWYVKNDVLDMLLEDCLCADLAEVLLNEVEISPLLVHTGSQFVGGDIEPRRIRCEYANVF